MNWKLVGALALLVVAAGCTSQSSDQPAPQDIQEPDQTQQQPAEETSETEEQGYDYETASRSEADSIVFYTGSGFRPGTVEIQQEDTVLWINNASRDMWVGSDRHPQHTEYEGRTVSEHCSNGQPVSEDVFDQCSSGDRFSFTFDKEGTWSYHNHEASYHTGTVVVN